MALKKRNKASAEFSMSSLTDIIFLLLIFFMLTSTLVAPNSLNLKLPGSSAAKPSNPSDLDKVQIKKDGRFYLNNKKVELTELESNLGNLAKNSSESLNILIAPDKDVPTQYVAQVMSIALEYKINGILQKSK